jgi:hypothetical protein
MSHYQPLETIRSQNLDERIQLLASVDVAEAPFLSCYLNLHKHGVTQAWGHTQAWGQVLHFA